MSAVHIIGAGLAGLSAAVRLAAHGRRVHLYEAAPRAGGRCRSYQDAQLGHEIDNGNHLVMSGNRAVRAYLSEIGASDRLVSPARTDFPFVDVRSGERWSIAPTPGRLPLWLLDARRRVPGTGIWDYLGIIRVLLARPDSVVADQLAHGKAVSHFWEPLVVAALNAPLDQAATALLKPVLRETFLRGADYCRPMLAQHTLAHTFIDPALARLAALQGDIRYSTRVRALALQDANVTALTLDGETIPVAGTDAVILAVPAWHVADLLPGISVPGEGQAIINVHFVLPQPQPLQVIGMVGSMAQWLFIRDSIASVTISAADSLAATGADDIAGQCWQDVLRAMDWDAGQPCPAFRVIKEKRATFDPHPQAQQRRPQTQTRWRNLALAGDYVATGLPATIEGAIRSGFLAADHVLHNAHE